MVMESQLGNVGLLRQMRWDHISWFTNTLESEQSMLLHLFTLVELFKVYLLKC